MATCGHNGQAAGMAAALCHEHQVRPRDLLQEKRIRELQLRLLRSGQWIPQIKREDPYDLAQQAAITASSSLKHLTLNPDSTRPLNDSRALLLPLAAGQVPELTIHTRHWQATELIAELRVCGSKASYTPDVVLDRVEIPLQIEDHKSQANGVLKGPKFIRTVRTQPSKVMAGSGTASATASVTRRERSSANDLSIYSDGDWIDSKVNLSFEHKLPAHSYAFVCLQANEFIEIYESQQFVTGITSVQHCQNVKVNKSNQQVPLNASGMTPSSSGFQSAVRKGRI